MIFEKVFRGTFTINSTLFGSFYDKDYLKWNTLFIVGFLQCFNVIVILRFFRKDLFLALEPIHYVLFGILFLVINYKFFYKKITDKSDILDVIIALCYIGMSILFFSLNYKVVISFLFSFLVKTRKMR